MSKQKKSGAKKTHLHDLSGVLDISRSGMGFVIVEGQEKDIMVKPHDFGKAFHGDRVRVEVDKHIPKGKRPEGKITDVIERKTVEFIGNLDQHNNVSFFVASGDKPMPDFYIPNDKLLLIHSPK